MNTGLDPEILAISDGILVPASYFMPPPEEQEDGMLNELSYDNAAIEMRPTHSHSPEIVKDRLKYLMHSTIFELDLAKDFKQVPSNTELTLSPAALLAKEDQNIESVSEFGCSPSYTLDKEYRRVTVTGLCGPDDTRFRSAGFHVHQELRHQGTAQAAVGVLDGVLGLTDVLVNEVLGFTDASKKRRLLIGYGVAGEHRTRTAPGGATILEYRSLSPWPLMSPESSQWVMEVTQRVCEQNASTLVAMLESFPDRSEIIDAVNNSDADHAADMLKHCIVVFGSFVEGLNAIRQHFNRFLGGRDLSRDGFISHWTGNLSSSTLRRGIDTRRKSHG